MLLIKNSTAPSRKAQIMPHESEQGRFQKMKWGGFQVILDSCQEVRQKKAVLDVRSFLGLPVDYNN